MLRLTVLDSFASLAAVLVEESDAGNDHGQLLQLPLLVAFLQRQERTELRLRKDALQGGYTRQQHVRLCLENASPTPQVRSLTQSTNIFSDQKFFPNFRLPFEFQNDDALYAFFSEGTGDKKAAWYMIYWAVSSILCKNFENVESATPEKL